jgi:hypothetical protein
MVGYFQPTTWRRTMTNRIVLSVFAMGLLAGSDSLAQTTGIPDMDNSWVEMQDGGGVVVLFVVPNGTGSPFTEARTLDGPVDATITLYLRDANNDPVVNYPREDILLRTAVIESFMPCIGGGHPDANTDINGETQWVNPLLATGWAYNGFEVVIQNLGQLPHDDPLPLRINNPDITGGGPGDLGGDGTVNLADVASFAARYFGSYSFLCDFYYDGVLDLKDIVLLAQSMGATCP